MGAWTDDELRRIGAADELDIAPVRRNGELRRSTPIWVVRAGDDLYVRAAYGADKGWHGVALRCWPPRRTAAICSSSAASMRRRSSSLQVLIRCSLRGPGT